MKFKLKNRIMQKVSVSFTTVPRVVNYDATLSIEKRVFEALYTEIEGVSRLDS